MASDEENLDKVPERSPRTVTFTVPNIPRPTVRRPQRHHLSGGLIVGLFLLAIGLSSYGGAWLEEQHNQANPFGGSLISQKKIVSSESQLISQIAKSLGPSVVSVNVAITTANAGNTPDSFGLFNFSQPQAQQEQAAGTGIIISKEGLVITNRHVVPQGTTNVSVTLSDGTELKNVSVVGRTGDNDNLDIAFLKINDAKGHNLVPALLGDSSTVQLGDDAVAIGNALGQFQNTVTRGIISGFGRHVQAGNSGSSMATENLDNLFQTDAAINEGNSGGPLANLNGQVIGINTAVAGGAQNIGFAIPINDVRGLITQVLKNGKFQRPYLGVRYVPLSADVANQFGLSVNSGAFVAPSNDPASPSVIVGGPAEQAGLQERDIITEVDGKKIDQSHSLTSLLSPHQPGDNVTLTIIRGSDTKQVSVTLGNLP